MNKRIFLTAFVVCLFTVSLFSGRYKILQMNKPTVKINGRTLTIGSTFSGENLKTIDWESGLKYLKVRNEETKRTRVITKRNINGKETPSLERYLTKSKMLTTRDFGNNDINTVELLDSITLSIPEWDDHSIYSILWEETGISKPLELLEGDSLVLITNSIYGSYIPRNAYFSILKYDLKLEEDSAPDSLGYLYIEPISADLP